MIVESKIVKTTTALVIPIFTSTVTIDPTWILVIFIGLALGWLARVGRMIYDRKGWSEIGRDLLVSLFIGGANGLLASLVIYYAGFAYLQGIGVAFICAFFGIGALETAARWTFRKLVDDFYPKNGDKE